MKTLQIEKKRLVIAFLLLGSLCSYSQDDALSAIGKIYNAYNGAAAIRFNGSMKMYAKGQPAKIIEKMQSSYTIKDKNFICTIGPVAMLLNRNYYISVDNEEKLMMVGRQKDLAAAAKVPVLNIDQFRKGILEKKILAVVIDKGATAILQLTDLSGNSGYNSYSIEYAVSSGHMKKVVLETDAYNDEQNKTLVLEINYTEPVPAENGTDLFSEKTFFSIVHNKLLPAPGYKNYQIINQL